MLLSPLVVEALAAGGFRLKFGRIRGRCGYVDPRTRTIVLNPDAAPDELAAELHDDLALLSSRPSAPPHPNRRGHPVLELISGGQGNSPGPAPRKPLGELAGS